MPIEVITTFFAASLLLALAPGPDNLFVLIHSAIYGYRSGIIVTLGLCSGLLAHTALVAIGISTLFKASSFAFTFLKVSGALYLLFLSWKSFRTHPQKLENRNCVKINGIQLYRRGIIMNVTNPKVYMFFMAFLPQFTSLDFGPILPQFFILGGLFILASILVFGSISMLSSFLSKHLNGSQKAQRIMNTLAGGVFAGIALKLILVKP